MDITLLLSFLSASVALTLMPGPDNIYVLTESVTSGKRNGVILSAGLASGIIIHTLIIATGLVIFIQESDYGFLLIKILGALYLVYLAYLSYIEPNTNITLDSETPTKQKSFFSLYKKGFFMNVLNPKVTLFFIAFLPQFVCRECTLDIATQIIVLGAIFMIQAFILFSGIAVLAGKLSQHVTSLRFWKNVKWTKIVVLLGLALFIFI